MFTMMKLEVKKISTVGSIFMIQYDFETIQKKCNHCLRPQIKNRSHCHALSKIYILCIYVV